MFLFNKSAYLCNRAIRQVSIFKDLFIGRQSKALHVGREQTTLASDNAKHARKALRIKPPDVLICTSADLSKASGSACDYTTFIRQCVRRDAYTVYAASAAQISDRSVASLSENTALVICVDRLAHSNSGLSQKLAAYFVNNGRILLLNDSDNLPNFVRNSALLCDTKLINDQQVEVWKVRSEGSSTSASRGTLVRACGSVFLTDCAAMKALLLACEVETTEEENSSSQSSVPVAFFSVRGAQAERDGALLEALCTVLRKPFVLEVLARGERSPTYTAGAFDVHAYFSQLRTRRFGQAMLYAPRMGSTMSAFDSLVTALYRAERDHDVSQSEKAVQAACERFALCGSSCIAVADQQTAAIGRGRNEWLSPLGQLAFTFLAELDERRDELLFQRLPIMQHFVALAFVEALREVVSQSGADASVMQRLHAAVRVKWPNDVYYVDESGAKVKLGGVLVRSSLYPGVAYLVIGVGVNVDNDRPTVSLNAVLSAIGAKRVTREQLLAAFMNRFETLIASFAAVPAGSDGDREYEAFIAFREAYYNSWMHSEQRVTVVLPEGRRLAAQVLGIDAFGFLLARDESSGETMSLQPDGNSFDLLENLIRTKT